MYAFELTARRSRSPTPRRCSRKTGGKALAGGQSLVAAMKLRLAQPGTLVDLSGIAELQGHPQGRRRARHRRDDAPRRGRGVRRTCKGAIPALAALAEGIGDRQVRNMGTLGGSIANNDPAAD